MAEIDIEKKKPIWPWIILVLVILAILYFLVFDNDEEEPIDEIETEQIDGMMDDDQMDNPGTTSDSLTWNPDAGAAEISGYLAFLDRGEEMGPDHEYTAHALVGLINATQAAANQADYDLDAEMESIKQKARQILEDPASEEHADIISQISLEISSALQKLQQAKFPELQQESEEVKAAASKIESAVPTLEQKEQIKTFFQKAGDLLEKME